MQNLQFVILSAAYFYFSLLWGRYSVKSGLNQKKETEINLIYNNDIKK